MKKRTKKKGIFVACEGKSEQAYVARLNELAEEQNLAVFLKALVLNGGGLSKMIQTAIKEAKMNSYKKMKKAILMDKDLCSKNPIECQKAEEKAQKNGFLIIWQEPDYEGFLRRHFGNEQGNLTEWLEKKPKTKNDLRRIGRKEVERAAAAKEIKQLQTLLQWMGWPCTK